MAKQSQFSSFVNNVNEILTITREKGITHLYAQDKELDGRTITIKGKELLNFSSCSYLGLETDRRLKDAAKDAVEKYGTQFSMSRTYASVTLYEELEDLLTKMFNNPIVLSTSSTLAHQSTIPFIIEDGDAVIFDQQAHISMQELRYKLKFNGITIDVLKHNNLEALQQKINELAATHNRIWYFLDGTYSMYGDFAPIHSLMDLLKKNEKLWLYIDDAHSMSIFGKNGTGYILSEIGSLNPRMVLTVSLAKAFGSAGGVTIFPNEKMYWRVKNWGGPNTYSGPQQPATIAASIASAKIHLTEGIKTLQDELQSKIKYCNDLLLQYRLPVLSNNASPIFFIGLGLTKVGYNLVERLSDNRLFVNLGIFPAVNENCTGIRFTITVHHTLEDIRRLVETIAYQMPLSLKEEGRTMKDIFRAFKTLKPSLECYSSSIDLEKLISKTPKVQLQKEDTINSIPEKFWNNMFEDSGNFTWEGLAFLENSFKDNLLPEDNWKFHYYIIRNEFNVPIIATACTSFLMKDDMLSSSNISVIVEEQRCNNKYYLTSKSFMMGTLLTEGNHLYIDKTSIYWKEGLMMLIDTIWEDKEAIQAQNLILRDFNAQDYELREFFMNQGFIPVDMPGSNNVAVKWNNREEYLQDLNSKKRLHLKKNVLPLEETFDIKVIKNATGSQIEHWYKLYDNVRRRNFQINSFKLPFKLFEEIAKSLLWDCIQFDITDGGEKLNVGIVFAFKTINYSNVIVGMDYNYLEQYNIYKQTLFQTILKGIEYKSNIIYLGLTSDFEKRKIGASYTSKVAFVQMNDHYNLSLLNLISERESVKELTKV